MRLKGNKSVKQESGFSLLELIIVLVVLLIITGSVFNTLSNSQKTFDAELANSQAQENARYAVDRIAEIIKTAGNNPQNITALNGLSFIKAYSTFNASTLVAGTMATPNATCDPDEFCATNCCPPAINILSDFDGDGFTTSQVDTSVFRVNLVTSEDLTVYLDERVPSGQTFPLDLVMFFDRTTNTATPIAEFVTDLKFRVDPTQNEVTIFVTARSSRAVAVEDIFERRFRYSSLSSTVKLRNR
jgi:prepilin-type N-terminal cleavage/methylation domain-containing protein